MARKEQFLCTNGHRTTVNAFPKTSSIAYWSQVCFYGLA